MAKIGEVYKCNKCGEIVEILHEAACTPECCGEPMQLLNENTTDAAREKHVPVVEKIDGGYRISVGSVEHPMTEAHYIEWIELVTPRSVYRYYLNSGDKPVIEVKTDATNVYARAYCNLHGLWKSQA